jgi:hypothetical protein
MILVFFQSLGKAALVAGNQIVCASHVGTLQESVIGPRADLDKRSGPLDLPTLNE